MKHRIPTTGQIFIFRVYFKHWFDARTYRLQINPRKIVNGGRGGVEIRIAVWFYTVHSRLVSHPGLPGRNLELLFSPGHTALLFFDAGSTVNARIIARGAYLIFLVERGALI